MSHLEERLNKDLNQIRDRIAEQAHLVESAVKNAVHALQTGNNKLAYATILHDHPINRAMREIDRSCHRFIAVHLPSGSHLRMLSSVIRANIELERIGDYAVTIARESVQLSAPPGGAVGRELDRMAGESLLMLGQAIKAFNESNAEMARGTMALASQMEHNLDTLYSEMMRSDEREKIKDILAIFVVFTQLKRVADQAKNLCEHTVFAVTGEQKAAKVYNILFLDEDNSCQSQLAEAVARKRFPNSARFYSAGRHAASALRSDIVAFMHDRGIDSAGLKPKSLSEMTEHEIAEQHVIVSLQGDVSSYLSAIPFHTSVLDWDVGPTPASGDVQACENLYREVAVQVNDLITLLHGEGAS